MLLSEEEKEKLVIDLLYNQHKSYRKINKEYGFSFNEISRIKHKKEKKEELVSVAATSAALRGKKLWNLEYTPEHQKQQNNDSGQRQSTKKVRSNSDAVEAYRLFFKGKNAVQVAIELNLTEPEVIKYQREYWILVGLSELYSLYEETKGKVRPIVKLYELMIAQGVGVEELFEAALLVRQLDNMKYAYESREKELQKLENQIATTRRQLENSSGLYLLPHRNS